MGKAIGGLTLALAVAFAPPAFADKAGRGDRQDKQARTESAAGGKTRSDSATDAQKEAEHLKLRNHIAKRIKYPASKDEVVASCAKARIKADDTKWVSETLPAGNYETPDDVMKALGWQVEPAAAVEKAGR